jgi:hypothetical protein
MIGEQEVIFKTGFSCKKEVTFFLNGDKSHFQCGEAYPSAEVKCPDCAKVPRRVRTKHR